MNKASRLRLAGAIAALVAVIAAGLVAGASASGQGKRIIVAVIKIKGNSIPKFKGADEVPSGGAIEVVNKTNPSKVGPHTFSLVNGSKLPKGESERRKCGRQKLDICEDIATAHEMTFHPPAAGEHVVESESTGWNASFDGTNPGDSWFTETQDETHSRTTAGVGKLFYMCIIHPHMQGSIKVVSP